jgi:hypothetical protein
LKFEAPPVDINPDIKTDITEGPSKPPVATPGQVVAVDKKLPSPVRVLGKVIESVIAEYYDIRIYHQVDASYFAQCTYKSDGRVIEAHGKDFNRVSFDIRHLAQQGLEKHDFVLVSDPRSNRIPGKDV